LLKNIYGRSRAKIHNYLSSEKIDLVKVPPPLAGRLVPQQHLVLTPAASVSDGRIAHNIQNIKHTE